MHERGASSLVKMLASPTGFEPRVYAMSVALSWAAGRRGLGEYSIQSLHLLRFNANDTARTATKVHFRMLHGPMKAVKSTDRVIQWIRKCILVLRITEI